jgi:hypothetical protein
MVVGCGWLDTDAASEGGHRAFVSRIGQCNSIPLLSRIPSSRNLTLAT